jgi:hypothetical protein
MKKTIYVTMMLAATAIFISCGGKKDEKKEGEKSDKENTEESTEESTEETSGSALEGDWEIKRATGELASMNVGVIYSFKGDKLTFGTETYKNPGTTVVTESTFTFQADGNELKFNYTYKIEGDTMIVNMEGSDQTFYMVKK